MAAIKCAGSGCRSSGCRSSRSRFCTGAGFLLLFPGFGAGVAGRDQARPTGSMWKPFVTKSATDDVSERPDRGTPQNSAPISLASDESSADLILGGGGEIWVKGYRPFTHARRCGLPTNGTPVYGGYFAVELKNQARGDCSGRTWLRRALLPRTSAKDLAKLIAKHVAYALEMGADPSYTGVRCRSPWSFSKAPARHSRTRSIRSGSPTTGAKTWRWK